MAKTSSENNDLKKILTHLTALDKKVDKGFKHLTALDKKVDDGFKEAAEFRQQTETNLAAINERVDDGFKEADKQFKEAAEFRKKTEDHFTGLNREILGIGDLLYEKTEAYHQESQAALAEFRRQTEENSSAINKRIDEGFKEAAEFRKQTEDHFAGLNREILGIGSSLYDKTEAYHQESLKFQGESYLFQQQSQSFQQQTRDFQNAMLIAVQELREAFKKFGQNQSIIQETFIQLKSENEKLKQENIARDALVLNLQQRLAKFEAAQSSH